VIIGEKEMKIRYEAAYPPLSPQVGEGRVRSPYPFPIPLFCLSSPPMLLLDGQ
jgi:hypothetical protein